MNTKNAYTKGSTAATMLVCAALFLLFSFSYLHFYQADLLAMAQHVWSKGKTHFDPFIGPVIITAVLYLLHLGVFALTRLHKSWHAITYFPSFVALAVLTSVDDSVTETISLGVWTAILPILLLLFVVGVWLGRGLEQYDSVSLTDGRLWRNAWINFATMCVLMVVTALVGTGNKHLHERLRIENLISRGHYDEALEASERVAEANPTLTMLRFYALSCKEELGDRLFTHNLKGGANAIMPNDSTIRPMIIDARTIRHHYRIRHYYRPMLLNKYLLNKNLDAFAYELIQQDSINDSLPRHYREALIMYNSVRKYPVAAYSDSILYAEFSSFNQLLSTTGKSERRNAARKAYGKTYWYYYKFE